MAAANPVRLEIAEVEREYLVCSQRFSGNDPTIGESIVAPLRTEDRTIGVINVKRTGSAKIRFDQSSVDSLQLVAGEIASSFVAAEAMRRTEEDRKQAIVLYELSRLATMGNDPQDDLETARFNELTTRLQLRRAVAELHRLEGTSIQKYGVQMPQ